MVEPVHHGNAGSGARLAERLLSRDLVTREVLNEALARQQRTGGLLGDQLIEMGAITPQQLEDILHAAPVAPRSAEETGIEGGELVKLLLKMMYTESLESASRLAEELKIPYGIVNTMLQEVAQRRLVEALGANPDGGLSELRYTLTQDGRKWAMEALDQSQYVGPVPVSLTAYTDRILRQRITNERIDREAIESSFADMVVTEDFVRRLGPGINAGRCILLYGPPGNGKTTVAEKIGNIFANTIYIPYAVEVEGQIMKVYDPSVHKAADEPQRPAQGRSLLRDEYDRRWVACERPMVITGGELTLDMLDLRFNPHAKFYEAPLHVKAFGGTFIIDDFGRQQANPEDILNRWIVPLESRIDFLKLHTGKSFSLPFDELVIFSTNLAPSDLMDPAFLRRIPYKIETRGPNRRTYRQIFEAVARKAGLTLSDDIFEFALRELLRRPNATLAAYQPKFIVEQVVNACKFQGIDPRFSADMVTDAIANLYAEPTPDPEEEASRAA